MQSSRVILARFYLSGDFFDGFIYLFQPKVRILATLENLYRACHFTFNRVMGCIKLTLDIRDVVKTMVKHPGQKAWQQQLTVISRQSMLGISLSQIFPGLLATHLVDINQKCFVPFLNFVESVVKQYFWPKSTGFNSKYGFLFDESNIIEHVRVHSTFSIVYKGKLFFNLIILT